LQNPQKWGFFLSPRKNLNENHSHNDSHLQKALSCARVAKRSEKSMASAPEWKSEVQT
jgi:hypothetical protein